MTKESSGNCRVTYISTHILTKRMTLSCHWICVAFNISTHILTKRMTFHACVRVPLTEHFNSHPHEEDDWNICANFTVTELFQLTSSRRGWHDARNWRITPKRNFNSHPHEEDDEYHHERLERRKYISTHILTKRMTLQTAFTRIVSIFQLTSSRRGWRWYFGVWKTSSIFQLTSSRRGWPHPNFYIVAY